MRIGGGLWGGAGACSGRRQSFDAYRRAGGEGGVSGGMARKSADRGRGLVIGSGTIGVMVPNYECPLRVV